MGQSLIYLEGSRIVWIDLDCIRRFYFLFFGLLVVFVFLATRVCNIFEFNSCHLDSICSILVFERFISGGLACIAVKFYLKFL